MFWLNKSTCFAGRESALVIFMGLFITCDSIQFHKLNIFWLEEGWTVLEWRLQCLGLELRVQGINCWSKWETVNTGYQLIFYSIRLLEFRNILISPKKASRISQKSNPWIQKSLRLIYLPKLKSFASLAPNRRQLPNWILKRTFNSKIEYV